MESPVIALSQVLHAVSKHPYPIYYNVVVPTPIKARYVDSNEKVELSTMSIQTVDVRMYAQKAMKIFNDEMEESREKYYKLQKEFDDYKKENAEFEKFKKWKREGRY